MVFVLECRGMLPTSEKNLTGTRYILRFGCGHTGSQIIGNLDNKPFCLIRNVIVIIFTIKKKRLIFIYINFMYLMYIGNWLRFIF